MFSLMSNFAISALMSVATLTGPANPTNPKTLSFDASAYVTTNNQIRVSVDKTADTQVELLLRSSDNQVVFRRSISKKDANYRVRLNVEELADGKYELEVKSAEGSIRKELNLSTQPVQKSTRMVAVL